MDIRTAFITGASSGIGWSLAHRLSRAGVEVALLARRRDRLEALAEEIAHAGGMARIYEGDVGNAPESVATVQRADDEMGGLDLVVANAGVGNERWAGKLRWEDVEPSIAVNVAGAAATLTAVLPRMVERKRGHLVGVSSLAGFRGLPRSAAYSASKAFLSTFLESLRVDLRGTGVTVTDVQPGFVRTPMTAANRFKMPFLVDCEDAVDEIVQGIENGDAVVAFPAPLVAAVRAGRLLPNALYDRAVTKARGR
ncbi:SDR family NAD(P)-dependent oxidoreductase [Vulgatibacter sp.]|uniref:SDR family NAD(P)-dependent oxidoreductase n=1 Tax=Vulgatibacter sp. TaxID=1971226 RepID=UPI0035648036